MRAWSPSHWTARGSQDWRDFYRSPLSSFIWVLILVILVCSAQLRKESKISCALLSKSRHTGYWFSPRDNCYLLVRHYLKSSFWLSLEVALRSCKDNIFCIVFENTFKSSSNYQKYLVCLSWNLTRRLKGFNNSMIRNLAKMEAKVHSLSRLF